MDNSFLANLTTKPIPKKSDEYTVKIRNPTPILDVVTGDLPVNKEPLYKKDVNIDNQSVREELLLKFNKKRSVATIAKPIEPKGVEDKQVYKVYILLYIQYI